jgi:hypothetical protein
MTSKDRLKNWQMHPPRNAARQLAVPEQNILISPVPHLLENNFPPTEDEVQSIQEIFSLAKYEERGLNKFARSVPRYTSSTQDAIYRETQKLRQNVQEFIHKHERLLSPLLSLPSELLPLIFVHCLPNLEPTWSNQRPTWKNRPLDVFRLSQVCQRWRIIALDTPQLWTILGFVNLIDPESSSTTAIGNRQQTLKPKSPNTYVEFLQEILNRSKGQGLCLWLYASPAIAYNTFRDPFVGLLAMQASRIVTLTMISSPTTVNTFCALCEAGRSGPGSITFPRLRRLVLDLGGNHNADREIHGFAHTPALKDVTVMGTHPLRLSLPWSQLRAYSETAATRGSRGNLNDVLSLAKNLERLDVANLQYDILPRSADTIGISQQASIPAKVIHVRLNFPPHNLHEQSISALLTHFYYPAIQTLRIELSYCDIPGIFLTVVNVRYPHLSTPFANLKKLYYRSREFDPSNFLSFLRLCPSLEVLDMELYPHTALSSTFLWTYYSSNFTSRDILFPALKQLLIHTNFSPLNFRTRNQMFSLLKDATHTLRDKLNRIPSLNVQLILQDDGLFLLSNARAYLNDWTTTFTSQYHDPIPLSRWCRELHEQIPPLKSPRIPRRGSGNHTCTFRFSVVRLHTILADIEKHELEVCELRNLYVGNIGPLYLQTF